MSAAEDGPIARHEFLAVEPDGPELRLVVEIGRPYDAGDGAWACPAEIRGFSLGPRPVYGEGSLQALALALSLVWNLLDAFLRKGGRLFDVASHEEVSTDDLRTLFARGRD